MELERTEVTIEDGAKKPVSIKVWETPPITESRYLIAGEVKYEDASGYLEMWNTFTEGRYFSRTLGEVGLMARLSGTSDWRRFMLPFNADPGTVPDRLEINVVLPGGGKVQLRDVKLYQTDVPLQKASPKEAFNAVPLLGGAVIGAAIVFWILSARKKRAIKELRKMTAADVS